VAAGSVPGGKVSPDLLTAQLYHLLDLLELMIGGADRRVIGPEGIDQLSTLGSKVAPGFLQTVHIRVGRGFAADLPAGSTATGVEYYSHH
jgi:hypothetical protein